MFSNIPSLETWVVIANLGVVIAVALSFVFGSASILLSRKLARQQEGQATIEKRLSDEKIATANEEAAKANLEAARIESEGKERVAKVEAAAGEKIAGLTAEAEQAKRERAEADKRIAVARADAAKANVRVEEEARKRTEVERALLSLQEDVRPRFLPKEDEAFRLLTNSPKGTVEIRYTPYPEEPRLLANDLRVLLASSGWRVIGFSKYTGESSHPAVTVEAKSIDVEKMPPPLEALVKALDLNVKGLRMVTLQRNLNLSDNEIIIFVGGRQ